MRMKENLECYIDGYNRINIYMAKHFYGGKSRMFHLKDETGHLIPLTIESRNEIGNYNQYVCTVDDDLEVGRAYDLYDEHCQKTPAWYGHIVKTPEFADRFTPDASVQLGCKWTKEKTTFSVWSPVASLVSVGLLNDEKTIMPMKRLEKGVWHLECEQDLLHVPYVYLVTINGITKATCDPYTPFVIADTSASVVDDLSLLNLPEKIPTPVMSGNTDAIIYEVSVRDMTSQPGIGITHPKTFQGFTEENETTKEKNTGFSYIRSLGVTHLQFMPVLDFGSVDEENPELYYNWGYDPMHFRALEGSYASNARDPRVRIEEFARMVQDIHAAGMKVTLDLVFNHVWNKDAYCQERLVPNYYFLMDENGNFSNGSFCGNDVDSRPEMSRRYYLDTVRYLIEVLDVDGFRFDLMGVLDYTLMNDIADLARSLKPDFMIYGEGWNMPSYTPEELRASQDNQAKMPLVGHFSDRFREVIRGNNNDLPQKGFSNGNTGWMDGARQVMLASLFENRYDTPEKAINYVECHDNHTLWDKNRQACKGEESRIRERRQILANAMVLLAQGVPFLHTGQEFGRTKQNLGNTYNQSDSYNRIDYARRTRHHRILEATQQLIQLRKNHPSFRHKDKASIEKYVSTDTLSNQVLVYRTADESESLITFFNPTDHYFEYILDQDGKILFDSGHVNDERTRHISIAPVSVVCVALETR